MKHMQFLAVAMLFVFSSAQLIQAKDKVVKTAAEKKKDNEKRNKDRKKAAHAVNGALNTKAILPIHEANNAIDAYNTAVAKGAPVPTAVQYAAINAVMNALNIYYDYVVTLKAGTAAVNYTATAATDYQLTPGQNCNNMLSSIAFPMQASPDSAPVSYSQSPAPAASPAPVSAFQCGNTPSVCGDKSNATCDDGTPVNAAFLCDDFSIPSPNSATGTCVDGSTPTPSCNDGVSTPDANGMCPDGTLMWCFDGSNPACSDQTAPC